MPRPRRAAFAAQGPERIEIRQAGQLIRSTVVPAGPFALTNLALIDRTSAVEVTTVDCNGKRRTTVAEAVSLIDTAPPAAASYSPQGKRGWPMRQASTARAAARRSKSLPARDSTFGASQSAWRSGTRFRFLSIR
ncbi:hypothetical protein FAZ69_05785 [Trinickia terrae]|uniref:Uncharacterized protein n=1 Tax=Trinickia terrae TaxID=2571161 RepID=A0A4U1IBE6_9BURK|nr:fimbria/pilus outer membrane usher protein [Trinickia terrae]TKC90886.1 hypothetical protein FAZ69_05785 [Trinickia terrae]